MSKKKKEIEIISNFYRKSVDVEQIVEYLNCPVEMITDILNRQK
jgi:hypothetical protein